MSGPRWAEGLGFYKDLSIKVRTTSLPLLTLMNFSRARQNGVFEKVKECVDLLLNLFATQMISNTLLS